MTTHRHPAARSRAGLTMVDLVITVMIIGILTVAAAPKFTASVNRARATAAAQRIKADLNYARQIAISRSSTLTVDFDPATHQYTIAGLADLDHPEQSYTVNLNTSPYQAALVSVTLNNSQVQFNRFGAADSGGTITVESGGYQKVVSIDAGSGKATIP